MKFLFIFLAFLACNSKGDVSEENSDVDYTYLALGDSYTKGESVCDDCGFPIQLVNRIQETTGKVGSLTRIAETGWTTTDLKLAITEQQPPTSFDLVTLLIGVNNQYQNKSFKLYEAEFPSLLEKAIAFAGGDESKVVVVSIPDYAFTPFGQTKDDPEEISSQLDEYNAYAEEISADKQVRFLNITDITRMGLKDPQLVASDGLHPSEEAYKRMVDRLLPLASEIID
jgi:acyl-CoA thioesterase I